MSKYRRNFDTLLAALISIVPREHELHTNLAALKKKGDEAFLLLPENEHQRWNELSNIVNVYLSTAQMIAQAHWSMAFVAVYNGDNISQIETLMKATVHDDFKRDTDSVWVKMREPVGGQLNEAACMPVHGCLIHVRTMKGEMRTGWVTYVEHNHEGVIVGSDTIVVVDGMEGERSVILFDNVMCWRPAKKEHWRIMKLDDLPSEAFL